MATSRLQLNQVDLQQVRWLLGGLIGVVSAWTVFYMEVDALLSLAVITLSVPFFALYPRVSLALPALFHRLAFPLIVSVFAFDLWGNREPLPAMIRLDLMLLCYRCIAPRGRREDLQLILLALFLVVVAGVFTVSPAFVLQILFFTGAALGLLLAVTLSEARAAGGAVIATGWEHVHWPNLFRRLREAADLRVLVLAGALFSGVVALSALLFLALPRFEISNDFFIDRMITKTARTGFSESIRFGEVNKIARDSGMAFAADVADPASVPADLYWRMLVLDEYTGEGFRASAGLRGSFTPARDKAFTHDGAGRAPGERPTWTIYYQPGVSRYLPLLGGFDRLHFSDPQALTQSLALRVAALSSEPAKMIGYRIEGMDTDGRLRDRLFAREHILPAWDSPRARMYSGRDAPLREASEKEVKTERGDDEKELDFLDLNSVAPGDLKKLKSWVAAIGGNELSGPEFAQRAGAWLQTRHSYSLDSTMPAGEGDVILRWIGSRAPGHCELFAGGLFLLARAAGHPARIITGFKGGVWNPTSGSITVRNSDAHAWCEIWDEKDSSWIRADATPGSRITPMTAEDALSIGSGRMEQDTGWSARLDGLRVFWYRRIVSFDQSAQVELVRETKDQFRRISDAMRELTERRFRKFMEWLKQPWGLTRALSCAVALGMVFFIYFFWQNLGRFWWMVGRGRRADPDRQDPVRREASRWLARLERRRQAAGVAPGPELVETRAHLLRLRYGAREGWPPALEVFSAARCRLQEMRRIRRSKFTER